MSGAIIGIYDKAVQNGRMSPGVRSGRVARLNVVQAEETEINADVFIDAGRLPQTDVLEWLAPRIESAMVLTARTRHEAEELVSNLPIGT